VNSLPKYADLFPAFHVSSLQRLLVRLWRHLARRHQYQFGLLLVLMTVSALAEVVSLGAVLPFLGILINPEAVLAHPWVSNVAQRWNITVAEQLILPITIGFISLILIAGAIRILLLWSNTRLVIAMGTDLSCQVYRKTLFQPYTIHTTRNSSEMISGMLFKIYSVVYGVLIELLTLISSALLLVAVTLTLFAINPLMSAVAGIGFGGSYALIAIVTRRRLNQNGQRIAYEQTRLMKLLQEGLGGIRDVLLSGAQSIYCDAYRKSDHPMRKAYADNLFIAQTPRFIMEGLGAALIALLAYYFSQKQGLGSSLPALGALVLGAQRLIPAMQHIFSAWSSIIGGQAALADLLELLDQRIPEETMDTGVVLPALPFQNYIRFEDVRFRFSIDGPWVLDGFNLSIPKGARVGLVGSTGSGKSTALDLLMGLLMPTDGKFLVDDQPISGSLVRPWQQNISHVPQDIYLADATFTENIAFGIPLQKINLERVRDAARQAQIADFIESKPEGYNAFVGERGIRLSGGQTQRIGIARALYNEVTVLVFDEATSALDNTTEQSVMDAIGGLGRDLTILIIAHRISTVRNCDNIVELEKGCVVAQGTYEQLIARSPSFRQMVETGD